MWRPRLQLSKDRFTNHFLVPLQLRIPEPQHLHSALFQELRPRDVTPPFIGMSVLRAIDFDRELLRRKRNRGRTRRKDVAAGICSRRGGDCAASSTSVSPPTSKRTANLSRAPLVSARMDRVLVPPRCEFYGPVLVERAAGNVRARSVPVPSPRGRGLGLERSGRIWFDRLKLFARGLPHPSPLPKEREPEGLPMFTASCEFFDGFAHLTNFCSFTFSSQKSTGLRVKDGTSRLLENRILDRGIR
jgi:hypothetical protein